MTINMRAENMVQSPPLVKGVEVESESEKWNGAGRFDKFFRCDTAITFIEGDDYEG